MRPYELLPQPFPSDFDPGPSWFCDNFAKKFIPDMIQMMNTGLTIDQKAVEDLRVVIDEVLDSVTEQLLKNNLIKQYQKHRFPAAQKAYEEQCTQAVRTSEYYLKQYKPGDMVHRTWVINTYLRHLRKDKDCRDKWTVVDLKKYNIFLKDPLVTAIIDKRPLTANKHTIAGMQALAEYKAELWNRPRYEKAEQKVTLNSFNPNSNKQMKEFFEMLKIQPLAFSKDTGEASWGRDQLEELKGSCTDPEFDAALKAFIDNSYSAIIKNNFIKAFDTFTIDGVLHGNIKLFGAKSFRNTSNSPNLLNAPSTGSIYAKPLKRCFIAPNDYVIYTADLKALEDRVIANLSGDTNKLNIFLEGLDGHSLNTCGYFKQQSEKIIGCYDDEIQFVKAFMQEVDNGNKALKKLRQTSKAPTFKLAYGGYPDADKGGVITQEIFDNYHQVLYPGITRYREEYILPTAQKQGFIHLGLGCRLYSGNASNDIRTLNNATVQFWSILTLIAINELNHRIREEKLTDEVKVQSTIYDSIYTGVIRDPDILKWVNDNMIELLTVQYLENEVIHNEAEGEIGLNWADLHAVPNNASIDDIRRILNEL